MTGVNYTGGHRNNHIRRKPDPLARAQASRFANSRASEAEARKLVGGMKKDAKGRFVEPGRKTRPTLAFAFAPQPPPAVEEPEEVDEIEDADEGNEGARILELEVERRRKLESSRMLSRLETMDPSSTVLARRALLARPDWVGTQSELPTSQRRQTRPTILPKSALRSSHLPQTTPRINSLPSPLPSPLPSFPAYRRSATPDPLLAYRASPPPRQLSEFAQSFYDAQQMREDDLAQWDGFEAEAEASGSRRYDEFGYEMDDVEDDEEYAREARRSNLRSWEREESDDLQAGVQEFGATDHDSILGFSDDGIDMDVSPSRPSSPQPFYEHDLPPHLAPDAPPVPLPTSPSPSSGASFLTLPHRSRLPRLPLETPDTFTAEEYYSTLARSMGMELEPSFFGPRWVDWTGPCCATREQRVALADSFVFTVHEAETDLGMQCEEDGEEGKVLGERMGVGCTGGTKEQMEAFEMRVAGRWEKEWASDWDYEIHPDDGWAGILARRREVEDKGGEAEAPNAPAPNAPAPNEPPAPTRDPPNPPPTSLSRISSLASPSPPPVPLFDLSHDQPLDQTSPSGPAQDIFSKVRGEDSKRVAAPTFFGDEDLEEED